MRSSFLPRTRSLVNASSRPQRRLVASARSRVSRKDSSLPGGSTPRVYKRSTSSASGAAANPDEPDESPTASNPPETPEDAEERPPKRRGRPPKDSASAKEPEPSHKLPHGLDILWTPDTEVEGTSSSAAQSDALPPPEIFTEALNNLLITLHPQTQYRAVYRAPTDPVHRIIEPTLALYCPIEGGDYVIDETVRQLARETDSEVLMIDAVQLAAGECGQFGKAASVIPFPLNPLHTPTPPPKVTRREQLMDDDEEWEPHFVTRDMMPRATLSFVGSLVETRGRSFFTPVNKARSVPSTKVKTFFDDVINVANAAASSQHRRPRLIYVRDFGMLAASSAVWYPALEQAVRSRRTGALVKQASPVTNPVTIIFGITPPIHEDPSGPQSHRSAVSMLMSGGSPTISAPKSPRSGMPDGEAANRARQKRLRKRLRNWERGSKFLEDDIPALSTGDNADQGGEISAEGANFGTRDPPSPVHSLVRALTGNAAPSSDSEPPSRFFRTSVVVPRVRSLKAEQECRIARRREINEMAMRMAVSAVGGSLERLEEAPEEIEDHHLKGEEAHNELPVDASAKLWNEWGKKLVPWASIMQIADAAVARAMVERNPTSRATLDPVAVQWPFVFEAWSTRRHAGDVRKIWMKESGGKAVVREREEEEEEDEEEEEEEETGAKDPVIEKVRNDDNLSDHERKILGCIVDAASMSTTFDQVHLPAETIDSVRTIVSLPILHPLAFSHGILKSHSMTGCLLFGPPGTGKTLTVRALAKEAGCRMMSLAPSDINEMYVGESEKLVKAIFSVARKLAPCILFIDELDALFGARSSRSEGGAIHHRGVINEFMQEMDGLRSSKDDSVIVIGATNRPFDLDDAVLRRLPRRLMIDLPGEKEREAILRIMLRDETLAPEVDLKVIAKQTENFSGSDLKHLCVLTALNAVKDKVTVPWQTSSSAPAATSSTTPVKSETEKEEIASSTSDSPAPETESVSESTSESEFPTSEEYSRVLTGQNFAKALKEIVPSASESQGSLSELRKWNDEFGEGGREKRKRQVWGKGRFGFIDKGPLKEEIEKALKVAEKEEREKAW